MLYLGEDHHRHRKIMHPAFSAPQLRSFLPLFQRIAGKVCLTFVFLCAPGDISWQLSEKWKGELVATGELEIMMNKWLSRATLDVIGEGTLIATNLYHPCAFSWARKLHLITTITLSMPAGAATFPRPTITSCKCPTAWSEVAGFAG